MPKVSVIIPTYNRGNVVVKAVKSALAQSLQNLEVVVVDDGSQDDTKIAIEGIEDNRVAYYFKNNGGAASARNLGLSKARGDYVAFLDSDDAWPVDYLEVMASYLDTESEYGAAYSGITVVFPDGRRIESYKRPEGKSGWITVDLFKRGFVWTSATLFRSALWKDFFFDENLKTSEDSDAFLRLSMRTKFLFVKEVEAFHRMSADSLAMETGVSLARFLVLHRFYYSLGGHQVVPKDLARRRLSHACRKVAEDLRRKGERKASSALYFRAIRQWPRDVRLYWGLAKNVYFNRKKKHEDLSCILKQLGEPVGPSRFS